MTEQRAYKPVRDILSEDLFRPHQPWWKKDEVYYKAGRTYYGRPAGIFGVYLVDENGDQWNVPGDLLQEVSNEELAA